MGLMGQAQPSAGHALLGLRSLTLFCGGHYGAFGRFCRRGAVRRSQPAGGLCRPLSGADPGRRLGYGCLRRELVFRQYGAGRHLGYPYLGGSHCLFHLFLEGVRPPEELSGVDRHGGGTAPADDPHPQAAPLSEKRRAAYAVGDGDLRRQRLFPVGQHPRPPELYRL